MTYHGFSIGYGDTIIEDEKKDNIKKIIKNHLEKIDKLLIETQEGLYQPELDKSLLNDAIENDIKSILNESIEGVQNYLKKNKNKNNNFYKAEISGSKGSISNISQIMGCVGLQMLWGERVPNGYTDRSLPHFVRHDISPKAKGYLCNSFADGLNPIEVYHHAMSGRIGVIDTAVKTAGSGYISRKLIKASEDLVYHYDGTVRNSTDKIIQFSYCGDNYDPIKLEKINNYLISYNNKEFNNKYKHDNITI